MAKGTAPRRGREAKTEVAGVKLLLDSHINKAAVAAIHSRCPGLEVVHIADWRGGTFRTAEDEVILAACIEEARAFVTYDLRTIPGLLRQWAAEERAHAGVIFIDRNAIAPNDAGALARALWKLVEETGETDMTNEVRYLRPADR